MSKKEGGQRPVINLKHLNEFVKSEHFKMEGLHTVKGLLRQHDWMAKVDLKDDFFMVPIAPQHRNLLLFRLEGRAYSVPIQLPSLWSLHSPKGLYKDPEAICGDAQIPRHPAGNLHGRHAVDGKFQADADGARPTLNVSPRESGIYYKQQEIYSLPIPKNRISGDVTEFLNHPLE